MKKTIINPVNNWSYWSESFKNELKNAHLNHNVGEVLVFDNDKFKVWTIHLQPGDRLPFHIHEIPYFWTALSEGKARSFCNDGSVIESKYEVGDTKNYPDLNSKHFFIHDLENIGKTVLIFNTIEFKKDDVRQK